MVDAVGQNPVFLCWMEEQTLDVEAESVFLIGGTFIITDQYATFNIRVTQEHYLDKKKENIVKSTYLNIYPKHL